MDDIKSAAADEVGRDTHGGGSPPLRSSRNNANSS
jgi:hypothetical protein